MNRITRISVVLLTIVVLAGAATAAEQKIINVIPADSLFCAQITNLDLTLSQIDQYLAGVLPPLGLQGGNEWRWRRCWEILRLTASIPQAASQSL